MTKAIAFLSVLLLLTQGSAMAAGAGRGSTERAIRDQREGCDCTRLTANTKLKLTSEQTAQLCALSEKHAHEIQPIRSQLREKGHKLKMEWLQTEPDRGKIETMRGEAAKLQEQMRAKLAACRADILKILTPEQRAYLQDASLGER